MTGRLDGKVAVVFGAGPNIGGTVAHFRAREGARVGATDIDEKTAGRTAESITCRGYEAFRSPATPSRRPTSPAWWKPLSSTIAPSTAS